MKFPRNARIFSSQLDAAPFATVAFLLVIFMMLGSLVYTPGVHIQLPVAEGLAGTDKQPI
jgi:biopolymer transport protein ExbD